MLGKQMLSTLSRTCYVSCGWCLSYMGLAVTANQLLERQRRPNTMGLVSLQLVKFGPHMG